MLNIYIYMVNKNRLTKRKDVKRISRKSGRKKLTNKKKRTQRGGAKEDKLSHIIRNVFSSNVIEYLPTTWIFINDLQNKYVHMVDIKELKKLIDSNKYKNKLNKIYLFEPDENNYKFIEKNIKKHPIN